MNINYDEIITKANERKVLLQNIAAMLRDAEKIYDKMSGIVEWLVYLNDMYKWLDAEGRALLPKRERYAMDFLHSTIDSANVVLSNNQGKNGLAYLCPEDGE